MFGWIYNFWCDVEYLYGLWCWISEVDYVLMLLKWMIVFDLDVLGKVEGK